MKFLYLILTVILNISCNITNKRDLLDSKIIETVKIDNKLFHNNDDYSEIIDLVEMIPLQTNDMSMIGNITKIIYENNKYYIFDRTASSIIIFDSKGKYINKLDRLGRGPEEYTELRDFEIDEYSNIYILSNSKIMIYDTLLTHRNDIKLNSLNKNTNAFPVVLFTLDKNYIFLFRGSFGYNESSRRHEYAVCCLDKNLKVINNYFPVTFKYPYMHQTFYKSINQINMSSTLGNDTIYYVQNSIILPKIYIDFNKKITTSDMLKNRDIIYENIKINNLMGGIQKIYEDNEYLCFSFDKGHEKKQAIFNKKSKIVKIINLSEKSLPFPWIIVNGVTEDSFFAFIPSYMLSESSKKSYKIKRLIEKNKLSDIQTSDNPIIIKFNFNF